MLDTTLRSTLPLPPGCIDRPYEPSDDESLLDLLDRAFEGWPKRQLSVPPIEHLRWKLNSHPHALASHVVAEKGGRIIAARPLWVCTVLVAGRPLLARFGIDRAVLPEFQRKRLMPALEVRMPQAWSERFDAVLALRNKWETISASPGEPHRRTIHVLTRPLDSDCAVETNAGWTLRRIDAFDKRVDDFAWDASQPYRAIVLRTKEYLNYRYADHRAGNYRIVIAETNGRMLGYIVTTAWQRAGQIADVLVLPHRLDVLESLISHAMRHLRADGYTSVECWRFAQHPYGRALESLGFDASRRVHSLSLQSLRGRDAELAFFADPRSAVHFSAGDTDLV